MPVSLEQWLKPRQPATITLAELDLTAPERTQLHIFENHEVALNDLEHSTLSHIYRDKSGAQNVVPLAGKVYAVKKAGEHWRLSKGKQHGPYLLRNAQGQWTLDLDTHHPRYGKILSRYMGQVSTWLDERDAINVEAVGMRAITAMSSWKAQCINEALNVATYYAVTTKRNLENFATLRGPDSRLGRFFSELFGVIALTPEQVQRVERRVDEVLDELINHTLSGLTQCVLSAAPLAKPNRTPLRSSCSRMQIIKSTCWTVFSPPPIDIYQNCLKKRVVALYPGEHAVQNVGLVHSGMGGFRLRQFNLNAEKNSADDHRCQDPGGCPRDLHEQQRQAHRHPPGQCRFGGLHD